MRVFISYRRSDSKDIAARIADNLRSVREIDEVFLDVESIAHGEHFPARLDAEINAADVVLCIIGKKWSGAKLDDGRRRIESEDDFVRREVASALEADKRIIPVLVDEAAMPSAGDIPASIGDLLNRNAISVRHTAFRIDFEILVEAVLGRKRGAELSGKAIALGALWRSACGLVLGIVAAILIASLGMASMAMPLETILGGRAQLAVLLFVIFAISQIWAIRFVRQNAA